MEEIIDVTKEIPSKLTMFLVKLFGKKNTHIEEEWEMIYYELKNRVYITYYKDFESGHMVHYE